MNDDTFNNVFDYTGGDATIEGGDLADFFYGGVGNDTLNGGRGSDMLYGGADDDIFIFDNLGEGIDTVYGSFAGSDEIHLSLSIFGGIGTVGLAMGLGLLWKLRRCCRRSRSTYHL